MRRREQLLNEIVDLLLAGFSMRGDDELEALLHSLRNGEKMEFSALRSPNEAVLAYVHPAVTCEAAVSGFKELAEWVEQNWEEFRDKVEVELSRTRRGGNTFDLPN